VSSDQFFQKLEASMRAGEIELTTREGCGRISVIQGDQLLPELTVRMDEVYLDANPRAPREALLRALRLPRPFMDPDLGFPNEWYSIERAWGQGMPIRFAGDEGLYVQVGQTKSRGMNAEQAMRGAAREIERAADRYQQS
jgi:hypothetical protein